MPQFAIILRDDFGMDRLPPAEQEAVFQRFLEWSADLDRRGVHRGVERLDTDARTTRVRDGQVVIDGPFTEGKETVMGFFLVEADTIEEAAVIAAGVPSVALGATVEVRPVAPFPKPGALTPETPSGPPGATARG